MKKLHLYMIKSFSGPFIATFFISIFVLLMQMLWRYIDDLVGKGLDFSIIVELLLYFCMSLVPMALPITVLLSSIMTFGTLGENYELIPLKSAGISLYRIMYPLIVFIVGLSLFAYFFANNILPVANLKMGSLMYDIRKHKPEVSFNEGIFTNDLEGYSIKVDRIDKESGMMYNMLIYNHTVVPGNYEVTRADSGLMVTYPNNNNLELRLFHGHTYTDQGMEPEYRKTYPFRRLEFGRQSVLIQLPDTELKRTDEDLFRAATMLNQSQLKYMSDSLQGVVKQRKEMEVGRLLSSSYLKNKNPAPETDSTLRAETQGKIGNIDSLFHTFAPEERQHAVNNALQYARDVQQSVQADAASILRQEEQIRKHQIEWHSKFTTAFACFIFFFIGAPLGAIIRKGGLGTPAVVSIFLFIVYYIISMIGQRAAREAAMTPCFGSWMPSFILLVLGVFLTYKSVTDSEMMSGESYANFLKKAAAFFKKQKENV